MSEPAPERMKDKGERINGGHIKFARWPLKLVQMEFCGLADRGDR